MFGPEGRPQHCCAWLGAACSFPECASAIIPEEVSISTHYVTLFIIMLLIHDF
jgi:hypothetical protein